MTEKGKRAGLGIGMFGAAGLLALFGLGSLVATAILALALAMDAWLAALIVAVVLFAGAGVVALLGKGQVGADAAQARACDRGHQGGHRTMKGATMSDGQTPSRWRPTSRRSASSSADTVDQLRRKAGRQGPGRGQGRRGEDCAHVPTCSRRGRGGRRRGRPRLVAPSPMSSETTRAWTGPRAGRWTPTTPASPTRRPTSSRRPGGTSLASRSGSSATTSARTWPRRLTYYAVLAIFPAAIALTALLGLVGQADKSVQTVLDVLGPLVSQDTLGTVKPVLEDWRRPRRRDRCWSSVSCWRLWSASGYVGAFGRAMNRIYEIAEGRPFWKLRPSCC